MTAQGRCLSGLSRKQAMADALHDNPPLAVFVTDFQICTSRRSAALMAWVRSGSS